MSTADDIYRRAEERVEADRRALADAQRERIASHRVEQTRHATAARDARAAVRQARLAVEDAKDAFARTAVAEGDGAVTEEQLAAAWAAVDAARMRLAASEAVADALGAADPR